MTKSQIIFPTMNDLHLSLMMFCACLNALSPKHMCALRRLEPVRTNLNKRRIYKAHLWQCAQHSRLWGFACLIADRRPTHWKAHAHNEPFHSRIIVLWNAHLRFLWHLKLYNKAFIYSSVYSPVKGPCKAFYAQRKSSNRPILLHL